MLKNLKGHTMYEWPRIAESYWEYWGTEPQRSNKILGDTTKRRRVILKPENPRVWFFGDSFVQCPDENIWSPITQEFNPVHRGVGGTGIEAVYAQLLICKDYIGIDDRVVITFSHHEREFLIRGIRGQPEFKYQMRGQRPIVKNIRQYSPMGTPSDEEYDSFVDDKVYTEYLQNIRWDLASTLKHIAMVNNIVDVVIPSLKTPYVACFPCFGYYAPQIDLLRSYNFSEKRIQELIQHLQTPKSLWAFAQELSGWHFVSREGWQPREPSKENTEKYERRMKCSNHFLDEDIVPFWNAYKGVLERLSLSSPPYK